MFIKINVVAVFGEKSYFSKMITVEYCISVERYCLEHVLSHHNRHTVEPRLTTTPLIRPARYFDHFILA